jgi:hypothetical protein
MRSCGMAWSLRGEEWVREKRCGSVESIRNWHVVRELSVVDVHADFLRNRLAAMIDFRYSLAALANRMNESAVDTDLRGVAGRGTG